MSHLNVLDFAQRDNLRNVLVFEDDVSFRNVEVDFEERLIENLSRRAWRYRNDRRGDPLLGIAISFCIIYVHSLYERVFIILLVKNVYCMLLALSVGIAISSPVRSA